MMGKPLDKYTLPWTLQGRFGGKRKFDIHTGIDLYCNQLDRVYAIEPGIVVNVCHFTGPQVGLDWWNDTEAVLIEGKSGVILYGEVLPSVKVGDSVSEGEEIGKILRVLKKDKGLPMDMLHLELYKHGYRGDGEIWKLDEDKPEMLKDPSMLVLCYIYDLKFKGGEYNIKITKNDDGVEYTILYPGGFEVDCSDDSFDNYHKALEDAVKYICEEDDDAYKTIMREINLNEILE